MKRALAHRLGLALAGILALAVTPAAGATTARSATAGGFSQIAGCISGADNLLVSVVVDESRSLRTTDPSSLRVQGITTAIDSLEQLTTAIGDETNVEVSLSTFARSFSTLVGWRTLDAPTAQRLRSTAERSLPTRDAGDATDYRQALTGAKRQLDKRQRALGDPHACKLLLWFTDGALDVDEQTGRAAQELCQVGGIADAVREDGIAIVALALFRPEGGVTQAQRDQLRSVAEGTGGGQTCGRSPIPSDSAGGVYLRADDPAALQQLFAGAGALVAGGTPVAEVACPSARCRDGVYRLDIDAGLAGARVLVNGSGANRVSVVSPSGRRIKLTNGDAERVDGAVVSYLVRDRLATVNIMYDPYASTRSRWQVRSTGANDLGVYWFWGAELRAETQAVRAGVDTELAFRLEDQNGDPLSTDLYRNVQAKIRVGTEDVPARITPQGVLVGSFRQEVTDVPSSLPVSATLSVRSVPGSVLLGPITVSGRLPVELPPAYPTVTPELLDFGQVEGVESRTRTLTATGSEMGPTTVCVTASDIAVPGEGPASDLIKPSPECLDLKPVERGALTVTLAPEVSAEGVATGSVTLTMTAADGSEDVELAVPVRLEMARHVDESTRLALLLALLLLALLVPAALLVGSNLILARFLMTSTSRTATKSVRVTPTGLHSLNGTPLLEPEDFENAGFSGTKRGGRLPIDGTGITLRARRIFSLKEPEGVGSTSVGQHLVSSAMPYRTSVPAEAPASLGEVDAAFVILNPSGASAAEAHGTLVMVVPGRVDRQGIHDRAAHISSTPDWRKVLSDIAPDNSSAAAAPPSPGLDGDPELDTGTPIDEPPPLPWPTDPESNGSGNGHHSPKKSRFGKRTRSMPDEASGPSSNSGDADDTLPPLPDFLK